MMKKTFGLFFPSPSHGSPRLGTDPRRNVGQGERMRCKVGVSKGREGLDGWTQFSTQFTGKELDSPASVEHQHWAWCRGVLLTSTQKAH